MDKIESGKILTILEVAYSQYFTRLKAEQKTAMLNLWESMLIDQNYYVVDKALHNILVKSKYLPTIAEMVEEIERIKEEAYKLLNIHLKATVGIEVNEFDFLTGKFEKSRIKEGKPLPIEKLQEIEKILGNKMLCQSY